MALVAPPPLELPAQYGKYELLERIGYGGMAEVFKARLPGLAGFEKIVVIKRLLPALLPYPNYQQMFIDEAKLAARIRHKNVVQAFDLGQIQETGELFMAMEYIEGTDLRQLLRDSIRSRLRIPVWFTLHVVSEVLAGLSYAHDLADENDQPLNIVHRDVTPSNVFISFSGDIKLGDFGIAKTRVSTTRTAAGEIKGKVSYMSPEQIYGRALDKRADIFSTGVLLWECLAQRKLFGKKPDIEVMNAICQSPRPPPSLHNPFVSPELDLCVMQALEADRERRISSASELQRQLLAIMAKIHPPIASSDVRDVVEVLSGRKSARSSFTPTAELASLSDDAFSESSDGGGEPVPTLDPAYVEEEPSLSTSNRSNPGGAPEPPGDDKALVLEFTEGDTPAAAQGPPQQTSWFTGEMPVFPDPAAPDSIAPPGFLSPPPLVVPAPSTSNPGMLLPQSRPSMFGGRVAAQPYDGPFPFFIATTEGNMLGPIDHAQVESYLSLEGADRGVQISADRMTWLDVPRYARLSGLEALLGPGSPPEARAFEGDLKNRSLTSLFSLLRVRVATGRLIIVNDRTGLHRREIHVVDGRPTYVYSNESPHSIPNLMLRRTLITQTALPAILHEVARTQKTIDVVASRFSVDVQQSWPLLMKDRLAEIFAWRQGSYVFDPQGEPWRTRPFARSLFGVLTDMVNRANDERSLRAGLGSLINVPLRMSERLPHLFAEFGLTPNQALVAKALAEGESINSLLKRFPGEEKTFLTIGYVLIESGLLLKPL